MFSLGPRRTWIPAADDVQWADYVKCPRAALTAGGRHEGVGPSCSSHGITRRLDRTRRAGWFGGSRRGSLVPYERKEPDMSTTLALSAKADLPCAALSRRFSGASTRTDTGMA